MNDEISIKDAQKLIGDGARVIDVRTPEEYARGHLEGSENINFYDKDFASNIEKLDRMKSCVVYCGSGGRSGRAVEMMRELGFTNCRSLSGGFGAWARKGMKVVV